jgi:hypothetical protein
MPYFQRKPYAEMIAGAVQVPSAATAADSGLPASLLERAAAILKEESTQLPKHPANSPVPIPGNLIPGNLVPGNLTVPAVLPDGIVMLRPKTAVKPGQTATLVMSVANESDTAMLCTVSATDLVAVSGGRIGGGQLQFSPREASVAPGAPVDIGIAIEVPPGIAPGQYAGLLVVSGLEPVHAVLTVSVIS